jgi:UDP-GlcNAc3NAcA epimerase
MHIFTVVGARPQFAKAAVASRHIRDNLSYGVHEILVHTGQHYDKDMSDVFFVEMDIAETGFFKPCKNDRAGRLS